MADQNTIKIKQRKEVNIGVVIFLFVLVYLTINVYVPLSKTEISIYEVPTGRIYSKDSFKGLIVRDEVVCRTKSSGYVNFYFGEGDRVSRNESIYSIGTDNSIYTRLNSDKTGIKLSADEISEMKDYINRSYAKAASFSDYEAAGDDIMKYYRRTMDRKIMTKLNEAVRMTGANAGFEIVKSECSGIISYQIDGYSNVNTSNFNTAMFKDDQASSTTYTTDMFDEGAAVCKVITSDDWNIIVELSDAMYTELADKKVLSFTIDSDRKLKAPVSFMKCGDTYFAVLSLDRYVSEYTSDRFVRISFDTEENEGLKVPVSSLVYKDFYRIPSNYFIKAPGEEDTDKRGLIIERHDPGSGEKQYAFLETDIFMEDQGFNYISADHISSGEYITTPDRNESTVLYMFTVKLEGVYNINNGYAVFKRIERLESANDYVLVKKNSPSGLSAYDHIALNGQNAVEGALIY